MPLQGQYEPATEKWVQDQVELYESSGGTQGNTFRDTGLPIVIVTNRGALVELQDGPHKSDMTAREITGEKRAQWWELAVAAYPPYAEYARKTED
jgi:hypothetical protein